MDSSDSGDSSKRSIGADDFVKLIVRSERRVRAFVATLHPHSHDVDEIVQDTCLVAWKKFESFRYTSKLPDEEFVRWLCSIARYELNNYRKKRGHSDLIFDESLLDKLAEQYIKESSQLEMRHQVLLDCMDRLRPRDQEIVKRRYQVGISVQELARYAGRTVDAIYKSLTRIRSSLLNCVEKTLKQEGVR